MIMIERTSTFVARWTLYTCLALVLTAPGVASAQSRYSGIVVFGTSLSDSGNAFALRGDHATPPDFNLNPLLIPNAPYARGGHHFSNGATWIEQFARSIGLERSVRPALAKTNEHATNYAVGAARAYDDGVNFNLGRQVDEFLLRSNGVAPPEALYVIEMGSNDIRDAFQIGANPLCATPDFSGLVRSTDVLGALRRSTAKNREHGGPLDRVIRHLQKGLNREYPSRTA